LADLQPYQITGSGFFVSKTGQIITNKNVAAPWESELAIDKEMIQEKIGVIDAIINTGIRRFNPKLVGVPVRIGIFLNDSEINKAVPLSILIDCDFVKCAREKEIDLALIQTKSKSLPQNTDYVNPTDIITDRSQIKVDDEITIIGYPMGFTLALKNAEGKIKSTSNHGRISKVTDKYEIQYDAGSTHGASGSPVFNNNCILIAINYGGMDKDSGFNFGILATHVKNLVAE